MPRTHWIVERGNNPHRMGIPLVLGLHKGLRAVSFFFAGTSWALWLAVSFGALPEALLQACQSDAGLDIRLDWAVWGLFWSALAHGLDENGFILSRLRDIALPFEVFVVDHDPKRKTIKIRRVAQSPTRESAASWTLLKFEEAHGAVRSEEIRTAINKWMEREKLGENIESSAKKN